MPDTFIKIASVTVGSGGASNITFSSIPSTYTDLFIALSSRNDSASVAVLLQLNGDTGNNYSWRRIQGTGSAVSSSSGSSVAYVDGAISSGSTDTASTFGSTQIYIPNYLLSQNKSISIDSVSENNGTTAYSRLTAGLWSSSSAITSVKVYPDASGNFVQYSTATLYGIKNS